MKHLFFKIASRLWIIVLLVTIIPLPASFAQEAVEVAPTQEAPPDNRFGIVEAYVNAAEATTAGAGYTRIILYWNAIQPSSPADWKPANVPDPFIDAELAAGREVVAVLIGTPDWASDGLNDSRAVPDMAAWGNFTKRVAQQYHGRIKHWVIWNEPDVWDLEHRGSTWLGTVEDYARTLKVAYNSIKSVDPALEVHLTGLTYHWDAKYEREQYLARLLRAIAADPDAAENDFFFDAVVYHLYYDPEWMFDILQEVRGMLREYDLENKPIWINETNAPPTDDPLEPPWAEPLLVVSSQEQAAFVIQAYALLLAGGAERVEFYKMRNSANHPEDVEPFGILRHDDSRRPAFAAYKVVTTHFAGYECVDWTRRGEVYVVTLERGDKTTRVLWTTSRRSQRFTADAIAKDALLVNESGEAEVIAAVNGAYNIELPGATCSAGFCFIGGAPRVLVENVSSDHDLSSPKAIPTDNWRYDRAVQLCHRNMRRLPIKLFASFCPSAYAADS